jgi:plastocyanin
MMRLRLTSIVALVVAALGSGLAAQRTGVITGTVTLTASRRVPLGASAYGRRGVPPKAAAVGAETRKVVVFLSGVKPTVPPAPMRVSIVQKGEQFIPPVAAVTAGSIVEFPNQDPYFHNVFSLSRARSFDLGRYPSGESRSRSLPHTGIVKVFCDIHSHMSALIMVLDHAWFTIPSDAGTFTLPPAPAGDYTLVAWHERIGEQRQRVTVTAGGTTRAAFTLPVLEPAP